MYSESRYTVVGAGATDAGGGVVPAAGQLIALTRIRANGQPGVRIAVVWDWGGPAEHIFATTEGDIDIRLDASLPDNQIAADGSAAIKVVVANSNADPSGVVGGAFEAVVIPSDGG